MKQLACLVLALVLACALCSCAQTGNNANGSAGSSTSSEGTQAANSQEATASSEGESNATPAMDMSLQDYEAEHGTILTESELNAADDPEAFEPYIPDNLERVVVGNDDRVTVTNTYEYPYSAIALLEMGYECGCTATGSGFMVKPNVLLTAAHCLVCPRHNRAISRMYFYFGYQKNGDYGYLYDGRFTYWYGTSFPKGYTSETAEWDYGIVRFEEPVGYRTGYFGIKKKSDKEIEGAYEYVAGYRDDLLKYAGDRFWMLSENTIGTSADAVAGNSGGPIFDNNTACGIYIADIEDEQLNIGIRISDEILDKVYEAQNPSSGGDKSVLVVKPNETGPDGYVLPQSSTHRYTKAELSGLTDWELYIARNEIAAKHGYKFTEADLKGYFESKTWYHGTLTSKEFRKIPGILNKIEEANIDTILEIEHSMGSILAPKSKK